MKENKNLLLSIIAIATLLVSIVGVTFAYFAASVGNTAETNVKVTTSTVDSLVYTTGDPISFSASQQNFYQGAPNLTGSTTSSVTLNANNTEPATYCYTLDLVINTNTFVYTVNNTTPELKVNITKTKAGGNKETILSDYDITTKTGTINIPTTLNGSVYKNNITAAKSETTTDTFNAEVTLINLGTQQTENEGKNFSGELKFTTVNCN
jgi:hypothetical protein